MRRLGGSAFCFVVLALLGCTEGAPGDSPDPSLGDAGMPPDLIAEDAAPRPRSSERTRERVDPRDVLGVEEQPAVPAEMVFIEDSRLALGAGYDPEARAIGPVCVSGIETLRGGGTASVAPWRSVAHLNVAGLVGFGGNPLQLEHPPEIERIVEALNGGAAVGIESDREVIWGVAELGPDAYAWTDSPECEGVCRVVHQLRLVKRRYTFIGLEFFEESDRLAFLEAHGTDLGVVFRATGLERARLERELAAVAVVRVFHFQIGGDRASTEALLASHRCSVTELAACAELIRDLDSLAVAMNEEPSPEPGNYHGWVPSLGFEGLFR